MYRVEFTPAQFCSPVALQIMDAFFFPRRHLRSCITSLNKRCKRALGIHFAMTLLRRRVDTCMCPVACVTCHWPAAQISSWCDAAELSLAAGANPHLASPSELQTAIGCAAEGHTGGILPSQACLVATCGHVATVQTARPFNSTMLERQSLQNAEWLH